MTELNKFDACIVGGGLAGLALSIQLSKLGYTIALFEKEKYPFHKVCGEYISLESWNFLEEIGVPLSDLQLPIINKLIVTAPDGNELAQDLPLGGFGISRYKLDGILKDIAAANRVQVFDNCKVNDVQFASDEYLLHTTAGEFRGRICCGSYGKRGNLDVKWNRSFVNQKNNKLNNYIAVKYHIKTKFPGNTIALHNFKNGYCGISKIEDDKYCLCYMTNAENLKASQNSIPEMEKNILQQNPHLQNILSQSQVVYESPLTISQISFNRKTLVENHVLMVGDAAGMITPLCGNGMSMALHGSKIAAGLIDQFLQGNINRPALENRYSSEWNKKFEKRLRAGRLIQTMFGKKWVTNFFVNVLKRFPFVTKQLIRQTHGDPF